MTNVLRLKSQKTESKVTICTQCESFENLEPCSPCEHIWYNHLCKATPLPTKVDPYDGKMKSYIVNALGGECFTENKFQYCQRVNDGKCLKFKPR
jgi:hypothetical protein